MIISRAAPAALLMHREGSGTQGWGSPGHPLGPGGLAGGSCRPGDTTQSPGDTAQSPGDTVLPATSRSPGGLQGWV